MGCVLGNWKEHIVLPREPVSKWLRALDRCQGCVIAARCHAKRQIQQVAQGCGAGYSIMGRFPNSVSPYCDIAMEMTLWLVQ